MVAETTARGRYKDGRKIFRIALFVFFIVGLAAMIIIAAAAKPFVSIQQSPDALWAVIAIAPAIFFGCIMSAYRGYYEGLRNMKPTAVSQLIEAMAKVIAGLILMYLVMQVATSQYEANKTVFGTAIQIDAGLTGAELEQATKEQIQLAAAPYTAVAAVLGVTISTLVGTIILFFAIS